MSVFFFRMKYKYIYFVLSTKKYFFLSKQDRGRHGAATLCSSVNATVVDRIHTPGNDYYHSLGLFTRQSAALNSFPQYTTSR